MVEEVLKLDFKICGLITPTIELPQYESIQNALKYKVEDTKRIVLLDNSEVLSTKNVSKLQLGENLNNNVIVLYDFSKGLNEKELNYFRLLFKKITSSYNKKVILVSRDINFLASICDTFAIYGDKMVYHTKDIFDDYLYTFIDMPSIVNFIKLAEKRGIKLAHTLDINELIKDIYRRRNENKGNI